MAESSAPHRVQLSRRKGWRMPENTVSVARPSRWGNPFKLGINVCSGKGETFDCYKVERGEQAVHAFRRMLMLPNRAYPDRDTIIGVLAGKNLACWCPLDQPCHADVLLELANTTPATKADRARGRGSAASFLRVAEP